MSPDTPSTRVIQPGYRAGRASSRRRPARCLRTKVRAVVRATVLTGDSTGVFSANQSPRLARATVGGEDPGAVPAQPLGGRPNCQGFVRLD